GREHLDRHITAERVVASEEDSRHAAAAEFTSDGVLVAERFLKAPLEIHDGGTARGGGGVPNIRPRWRKDKRAGVACACLPPGRRGAKLAIFQLGATDRASHQ